MGYKNRDVEICLSGGLSIVVACDSSGGVGLKGHDEVRVPNGLVGRMAARVALFEIISVGALPVIMTAAITAEPVPTGTEIVDGIKELLQENGLSSIPVAVSTEKNFETCQTGIGVSVTGICKKSDLRIGGTKPGDSLYCLGSPLVGGELVGNFEQRIPSYQDIRNVIQIPGVHDVIPVGSRGISVESATLLGSTGLELIFDNNLSLDLEKSAGPSTCVIVSCEGDPGFENYLKCPVYKLGITGPLGFVK